MMETVSLLSLLCGILRDSKAGRECEWTKPLLSFNLGNYKAHVAHGRQTHMSPLQCQPECKSKTLSQLYFPH